MKQNPSRFWYCTSRGMEADIACHLPHCSLQLWTEAGVWTGPAKQGCEVTALSITPKGSLSLKRYWEWWHDDEAPILLLVKYGMAFCSSFQDDLGATAAELYLYGWKPLTPLSHWKTSPMMTPWSCRESQPFVGVSHMVAWSIISYNCLGSVLILGSSHDGSLARLVVIHVIRANMRYRLLPPYIKLLPTIACTSGRVYDFKPRSPSWSRAASSRACF